MHTQSPNALVTSSPYIYSPTPPKEIHSNSPHPSEVPEPPQPPQTQQQQQRHTRHPTLITRGKHNFMRQHFKVTHRCKQTHSTHNHCRLKSTPTPTDPDDHQQNHTESTTTREKWRSAHDMRNKTHKSSMVPHTHITRMHRTAQPATAQMQPSIQQHRPNAANHH